MKVDFSLSLEDYWAYQRYVEAAQAQRRRGRRVYVSLLLLAMTAALVLMVLWANDWKITWNDPATIAVAAVIGLQGIAATCWLFFKRTALGAVPKLYEADRAGGQTEGLSCELTPDHVVYATRQSPTSLGWSLILHIGQTEDHLFLMNSRTTGFVIPRHAFPTEQDFQAFAEKAREYHVARGNQ